MAYQIIFWYGNNALVRFYLSILIISALFVLPTMALAAPLSPFVGHWVAADIDGSDSRLTIAGPPNGPFQITWTDSYMSFCDGEAGIVRGTGLLNEDDGYNYIRLAPMSRTNPGMWHSTLNPGLYEPERAEAALQAMDSAGPGELAGGFVPVRFRWLTAVDLGRRRTGGAVERDEREWRDQRRPGAGEPAGSV